MKTELKPVHNAKSRQILVFDFDGVICNSIHDSLMTAVNTYIEFVDRHQLPIKEPLKSESVLSFEQNHPEFFHRFSEFMPLGNFAMDYYVFMVIIEKDIGSQILEQSDFEAVKRTIAEETLLSYSDLFYKNRRSMQEKDPGAWARLLPPFPGIAKSIALLSERFLCAISTSKDHNSVDILLKSYGLNDYFQKQNILDKDFAESKRDHLVRFHQEHGVPFSGIHFIDDKVLHLISVKDLGVHAYLALWGFNTQREHETARSQGFNLLRLKDLPKLGNEINLNV
jgi:phosphoglycolate phosphatase-like HAD superfamily hydrolase